MTSILLLPVVYGVVLGLSAYFTPMVKQKQAKNSEPMVFISVAILIAKFGTEAGPALPKIIAAGPALILQEFGSWFGSGVVATMIYYGLQLIDPAYFLAVVVLLCSIRCVSNR